MSRTGVRKTTKRACHSEQIEESLQRRSESEHTSSSLGIRRSTDTARRVMGLPVYVGAFQVGIVEDVVLGADAAVILGFVVKTHAGHRGFLPWMAADIVEDESVGATAATLLGELELDYYLQSGIRLSRLPSYGVEGMSSATDWSSLTVA